MTVKELKKELENWPDEYPVLATNVNESEQQVQAIESVHYVEQLNAIVLFTE